MFVIIYGMRYATVMCCVVHQATLQACEWDYNVEESNIGTQQSHKVMVSSPPCHFVLSVSISVQLQRLYFTQCKKVFT